MLIRITRVPIIPELDDALPEDMEDFLGAVVQAIPFGNKYIVPIVNLCTRSIRMLSIIACLEGMERVVLAQDDTELFENKAADDYWLHDAKP